MLKCDVYSNILSIFAVPVMSIRFVSAQWVGIGPGFLFLQGVAMPRAQLNYRDLGPLTASASIAPRRRAVGGAFGRSRVDGAGRGGRALDAMKRARRGRERTSMPSAPSS